VWEIHPVMKLVQNEPWAGGGGAFAALQESPPSDI